MIWLLAYALTLAPWIAIFAVREHRERRHRRALAEHAEHQAQFIADLVACIEIHNEITQCVRLGVDPPVERIARLWEIGARNSPEDQS